MNIRPQDTFKIGIAAVFMNMLVSLVIRHA